VPLAELPLQRLDPRVHVLLQPRKVLLRPAQSRNGGSDSWPALDQQAAAVNRRSAGCTRSSHLSNCSSSLPHFAIASVAPDPATCVAGRCRGPGLRIGSVNRLISWSTWKSLSLNVSRLNNGPAPADRRALDGRDMVQLAKQRAGRGPAEPPEAPADRRGAQAAPANGRLARHEPSGLFAGPMVRRGAATPLLIWANQSHARTLPPLFPMPLECHSWRKAEVITS